MRLEISQSYIFIIDNKILSSGNFYPYQLIYTGVMNTGATGLITVAVVAVATGAA